MGKPFITLSFLVLLCANSFAYAAQVFFSPSFYLSETYTDNADLSYENPEGDTITTAGLQLAGQLLWKTAGIDLSYNPSYNFYAHNSDLDNWRHQASLGIWKDFSKKTKLTINDSYLRTNDPNDAYFSSDLANQLRAIGIQYDWDTRKRVETEMNTAQIRLSHQLSVKADVFFACLYRTFSEVDPPSGTSTSDSNTITPSLGFSYNFAPQWDFSFQTSYAKTDYAIQDDRTELNGNFRLSHSFTRSISGFANYRHTVLIYDQDTNENYQIYDPSLGVRYNFQDNAYAEIALGYYIQDFERSNSRNGFNITADINKRWTIKRWYLNINGGSGYYIDDNGTRDEGLTIYYLGRIETGYQFTRWLAGSLYGQYRYNTYPNEKPQREDNYINTGASLNWQALKWMDIALSYNNNFLSSTNKTDGYTENNVTLTIRIFPPHPYRLN